jgi:glycine/D-amino acid oxidase-like deaminating enzyme
MDAYPCEVVIVGGGVLGWWVLDELLRRGYRSPLLLEQGQLGCRQTCHSHAFLHQGYAYYGRAGVAVFADSWGRWSGWPTSPNPPIPTGFAHHAFIQGSPPARSPEYLRAVQWQQNQLPPPPAPQRTQMNHPSLQLPHDAIETTEMCVPADWVVRRLRKGKVKYAYKIKRVD